MTSIKPLNENSALVRETGSGAPRGPEDAVPLVVEVFMDDTGSQFQSVDPPTLVCTEPCFMQWQFPPQAQEDLCQVNFPEASAGIIVSEPSADPRVVKFWNACEGGPFPYTLGPDGTRLRDLPTVDNEPKGSN